eukprot:superscaffoldBa00000777_g7151
MDGCSICPSPEVRNLGVILDPTLLFQSHIKSITICTFYRLKNISIFQPSLSDSMAETLIHAFITSHLDYCNGVLAPNLQSSDMGLLSTPNASLQTFGDRAFSVAAPVLWNSLPAEIHNAASMNT